MIVTSCAYITVKAEPGIKFRASDMNALMIYILSKPALLTGETTFPLCLPGVADDGFLQFFSKFMTPNIGIIFAAIRKEDMTDFAEKANNMAKRLEEIGFVAQITKSIQENYLTRSPIVPNSTFCL